MAFRMGRNSVCHFVCQRGLRANCRGLRAWQTGLRACARGLSACQNGLPEGPEGLPKGPERLPEGPEGLPERPEEAGGDGRTDGRTYGISPHSTGLRPLSEPLPCYVLQFHHIKKAGHGYR